MRKVLLDSTTYVDLERLTKQIHKPWAINTMRNASAYSQTQGKPFLSTLTAMEIAAGFNREFGPKKLQVFLQESVPSFEVVGFDLETACLTGEIYTRLEKARLRIGIPDTGIAATAIREGLVLVTSNIKHFQRVIDLGYPLTIANWREE